MTKRRCPEHLVVASHNSGKIAEISTLLAPYGRQVVSAADMGLPEPEETGTSYEDNATLKAVQAARHANMAALSDDSGFDVAALGGRPGVYSARWAGPERDFSLAMQTVWSTLVEIGASDMSARFCCVLCLAWPDGHLQLYRGQVTGVLTWPPRGDKGFGYDPMFIARGHGLTFGQMEPSAKHAISHRADAFSKLIRDALS